MVKTVSFSQADWLLVGGFLALILALGFSARLKQNSILQFLTAGRALSLPLFVCTLVSTWYGGILGVGESVSYYGLGTFLLLGVPYYVFGVLYAKKFARRVREAEQISIPERIERTFGKVPAVLSAVLLYLLAIPAAQVLMLGTLLQSFTGWPLPQNVLVATFVGSLFLLRGGLLADVRVSTVAFGAMYLGFAVMVVYLLGQHPLGEISARIQNKSLLTVDGGAGWTAIVSFFILGAWTMVDPAFHQRVASARDPGTGQNGILISVLLWIIFDCLTITTGLYALAFLKNTPEQPLLIFPIFGDQILPPGLKGVFFCGMLGTMLCAMVGYALVSGATLGREIVCRVKSEARDQEVTLWTRIGIVLSCLVGIVLALWIGSVVSLWYAWAGVIVGALLLPLIMSYGFLAKWNQTPRTVSLSIAVSFVGSLSWLVYGWSTGNKGLEIALAGGQKFSIGTLLPALVLSALTLWLGNPFGGKQIRNESGATNAG